MGVDTPGVASSWLLIFLMLSLPLGWLQPAMLPPSPPAFCYLTPTGVASQRLIVRYWEAAVQPQVTRMRQVLRGAGPLRASSPHGALRLTKPSTGELRDPVFRKRMSAVKVSDIQERPCFFFFLVCFFLTRNLCSPVKKNLFY